jgi:hypothetical protein
MSTRANGSNSADHSPFGGEREAKEFHDFNALLRVQEATRRNKAQPLPDDPFSHPLRQHLTKAWDDLPAPIQDRINGTADNGASMLDCVRAFYDAANRPDALLPLLPGEVASVMRQFSDGPWAYVQDADVASCWATVRDECIKAGGKSAELS